MPKNVEPLVNAALAEALGRRNSRWRTAAEQSHVFGNRALRPDVLVTLPGNAAVAIETEFAPAHTVEADARARLGKAPAETDLAIEQAIAVRMDGALRDAGDLRAAVEAARIEWCIWSEGGDPPRARWPERGWLAGGIGDLAMAVEQVAFSERLIARGMTILEEGVRRAAGTHRHDAEFGEPTGAEEIAELLHQEDGAQTSRMAMAIVANAMIFHMTLAGRHGIPHLDALRGQAGYISQWDLARCWRAILRINYWPIFKIATDIVAAMRGPLAHRALDALARVAGELHALGAGSLNDLSGRMFQRLIADRKFLATFYTLPNSSALLAELAIPALDVDWRDPAAVKALRIGDMACGTGALLQAAYRCVLTRHRHAGCDDSKVHARMMEHGLVAADIMPAATHLTASNLSAAHPGSTFRRTCVYTMPYGRQPQEKEHPVAIGSLDLLEEGSETMALFGTGQTRTRGDRADAPDVDVRVDIPHDCLDLAIMNPPFTRPTNHEIATVPVPSFAGFGTARDEQREMSKRLNQVRRGMNVRAGHGNAGLASHFVDLADVKTRPGGMIALVLPASFAQGESWASARRLVEAEYEDVVVAAIAATGLTKRAFSADTAMAEVLLVARKRRTGEAPSGRRALFANLKRRPQSLVEATDVARAIRDVAENGAETGWLTVGDSFPAGCYARDGLVDGGASGVGNPELAEAMLSLAAGRPRLPRSAAALDVPLAPLGDLGERGPLHRDLSGKQPDGSPRGPWDIVALDDAETPPTYPALWAHDADRERCMVVGPDRAGRVREGCRDAAASRWREAASKLHFSLDFRLNSQSLAACLTPEPVIGGTAWPSFAPKRADWEEAMVLWANTTLGLMSFWWKGSRQHQGRARITLSRLPGLPVLDLRALSDGQIGAAEDIFAEFRERPMLPASEAYRDEVRAQLDHAVLCGLLGLPENSLDSLALLRDQWCAEPSVHGGKETRIGACS